MYLKYKPNVSIFKMIRKNRRIKMDWKTRLRNKTFIMSVVAFVFYILKEVFGFVPTSELNIIIDSVIAILVAVGVVIAPNTPGIKD